MKRVRSNRRVRAQAGSSEQGVHGPMCTHKTLSGKVLRVSDRVFDSNKREGRVKRKQKTKCNVSPSSLLFVAPNPGHLLDTSTTTVCDPPITTQLCVVQATYVYVANYDIPIPCLPPPAAHRRSS